MSTVISYEYQVFLPAIFTVEPARVARSVRDDKHIGQVTIVDTFEKTLRGTSSHILAVQVHRQAHDDQIIG